jgi:hypothetical protein
LSQNTEYSIRIRATNPAGESSWITSDSSRAQLIARTLVDPARLPGPDRLAYERSTGLAHIKLPPSAHLNLIAVLELRQEPATKEGEDQEGGDEDAAWIEVGRHALKDGETYGKLPLVALPDGEDPSLLSPLRRAVGASPTLRGRLCLDGSTTPACGPYIVAETVEEFHDDSGASGGGVAQPWLVALIVVATLLGLVAILVAIKCVCRHGGSRSATRPGGGGGSDRSHNGGIKKKKSGTTMLGPELILDPATAYKAQIFAIAGDNQHGTTMTKSSRPPTLRNHLHHHHPMTYDEVNDAPGDSSAANSQEPLWAYQQSPADSSASSGLELHYPAAALQGYADDAYPGYPYIDETPTEPDHGSYFVQDTQEFARRHSRVLSGECT